MASPSNTVVNFIKSCFRYFQTSVSATKANDSLNKLISEANELSGVPKKEEICLENIKGEYDECENLHQSKDVDRFSQQIKNEKDSSKFLLPSFTFPSNSIANNFNREKLFASDKTKFLKSSLKSKNNTAFKNGNLCKSVKNYSKKLEKELIVSKPTVSKPTVSKPTLSKPTLSKPTVSKPPKSSVSSLLQSKVKKFQRKENSAQNKKSILKNSLKSKNSIPIKRNNQSKCVKKDLKKLQKGLTASNLSKYSSSSSSGAKAKESQKKKTLAANKVQKRVSQNCEKKLIIKRNNLTKRVKRQSKQFERNHTTSKPPKSSFSSSLAQTYKQEEKIIVANETPKMFHRKNSKAKDAQRFSSSNSTKDSKIIYPKELIRQPSNLKFNNFTSPNSSLTEEKIISFFEEKLYEAFVTSRKTNSDEKPRRISLNDRTVKKVQSDAFGKFVSPKSFKDVKISPSHDVEMQTCDSILQNSISSVSSKTSRKSPPKKITFINKETTQEFLDDNSEVDSKENCLKLLDLNKTLKKAHRDAFGSSMMTKSNHTVKISPSRDEEIQVNDCKFQNSSPSFSPIAQINDFPKKSILIKKETQQELSNNLEVDFKESFIKHLGKKRIRVHGDCCGRFLSANSKVFKTPNADNNLQNSSSFSSLDLTRDSPKKLTSITNETPKMLSNKKPKRVSFDKSINKFKKSNHRIKIFKQHPIKELVIRLEDIKYRYLSSLTPPELKSKGFFKKNTYVINGPSKDSFDQNLQEKLSRNTGCQLRKRKNLSSPLKGASTKLVRELFTAELPESSVIFSLEPECKKRRTF